MGGFMRDILTTLSYEPTPAPADMASGAGDALSRLDQRLVGLGQAGGGQRTTLRIQPDDCSVWEGNPRDQPGLTAESCRSLIESIAAEGGNRIPVLVRLNGPDAGRPYELLVGSRRRFATDWLNHNGRPELRLNALIVDLSDEEAFRLADIENRERADITELDRARSYQNAVDLYYDGVQSRMAHALSLSNSQLSRLLSLAQMPDEVVGAFGSRDELRVRHSEVLTPLLRKAESRERIIAAAIALGKEQQARAAHDERMIAAPTVLARLKAAATPPAGEGTAQPGGTIMADGEAIGRVRPLKAGAIGVDLTIPAGADLDALFDELREALLAARREAGVSETLQ